MKKLIRATVVTLIVLLAVAGVAYATTLKEIPAKVTITTGAELSVYSDSACSIPMDECDFGAIPKGESSVEKLYVVNTGNAWARFNVEDDCPHGHITTSPTLPIYMSPGSTKELNLTLNINQDAPLGELTGWSITLEEIQ